MRKERKGGAGWTIEPLKSQASSESVKSFFFFMVFRYIRIFFTEYINPLGSLRRAQIPMSFPDLSQHKMRAR